MKYLIAAICLLISMQLPAQRSEFERSEKGRDMLAKTDGLIKQLNEQGYTVLNRIDTVCECFFNYNCVNFLNQYLTDEVSAIFCLSSHSNGVKLNGTASERSKSFKSYRWNEYPNNDDFPPYAASYLSWDGILDEITPEWYDFSRYDYGRKEFLITLYVSKANKAKLNGWLARAGKEARTPFMPFPKSAEKLKEEKESDAEHKKYLLSLSAENRKAFTILDSIRIRFKQQDIWGGYTMDTVIKENESIMFNEKLSKLDENIFSIVSKTPLTSLELKGSPYEAWYSDNTEVIKDINTTTKDFYIRNIHMTGSIRKLELRNNGNQPVRVWIQQFNNSHNPYYWRCREFLAELAYVRNEEAKQKAEKAKAQQEAIAAERLKEIKAKGMVCRYCNGSGVEYEYSKCILCGGDGETTEFVTGQKTVGQKKIYKSTTVSGNEVYEIRDNNMVTVEGRKRVVCKNCNGNGSIKSNKKHACPVCDGKGKVY